MEVRFILKPAFCLMTVRHKIFYKATEFYSMKIVRAFAIVFRIFFYFGYEI